MSDAKESAEVKPVATLGQTIGAKATRKLRERRRSATESTWFGLGMMGLVGWSVAIPTLLGAALGIWLDAHHPGVHAWTLSLLVAGLVLGCVNAGYWVAKQDAAMRDEPPPDEQEHDDD